MSTEKIQTIFRTVRQNRYMILDKQFVNSPKLSLAAKGLLCYLLSKPDNFSHNEHDILNHCNNGRTHVRSAIHELCEAGYVRKLQSKFIDGRFSTSIWMIFESPELDKNTYHTFLL